MSVKSVLGGSKQKSTTKPTTPEELTGYFNALDQLTGGQPTQYRTETIPGTGFSPGMGFNPWTGSDDGNLDVWQNYGRGTAPQTRQVAIPGSAQPGRLSAFARNGTPQTQYQGPGGRAAVGAQQLRSRDVSPARAAVDPISGPGAVTGRDVTSRDVASRDVDFEALGPDMIRALGGMGATRELALDRARETTFDELAADPRLSTFQRVRGQQLTDRDISAQRDAIMAEAEAAITALAEGQQARRLETDTGNAQRALTADTTSADRALSADTTSADRALRADEGSADRDLTTQRANLEALLQVALTNAGREQEAATGNADRELLAGRSNQSSRLTADLANQDLLLEEARRQYEANRNNANLTREDLETLANIFFGGKGTTSTSKGSSSNGLAGLASLSIGL